MNQSHEYRFSDCKVSADGLTLTYECPASKGIAWTDMYCSTGVTVLALVRSRYGFFPDLLLFEMVLTRGEWSVCPWSLPAIALDDQQWILEVRLPTKLPPREICFKLLGYPDVIQHLVPHKGRVEHCFLDSQGIARYVVIDGEVVRTVRVLRGRDEQIAYAGPAPWRSLQSL